jgi:uncharacterized protein (DUF885 family)
MTSRRTLLAGALAGLATRAAAGEAGYRTVLEAAFGGPVDPVQAHGRAFQEARRAEVRADRLLRGQGLTKGSVAERLAALFRDGRYLYPDDDAGRDRAAAEMNGRIAALRPRLPLAFGDLAIPPAEVRRMSPADAAAGKAGFRVPAHGAEPGDYYVDLKAIGTRPSWTLASVAFHEVTPGHLLQLPLQAAAAPPPERVKSADAFFEAWAIYAEQLAADLGAYAPDPLGEIGWLHWRLFRLGRVVADTGLHALGWSLDRTIAEMQALQGPPVAFVSIEADAARMMREPGRFAAEGLGALQIARLRPPARGAWPTFHRKLLLDGPWPPGELGRVTAGGG